jgi:hypothetical protein
LLYSVPYQHFTNSIENYFSMMKSRLQKLDGLTHKELKTNIDKVIKEISKEKYENIIKGTYNRTKKYSKKPSNRRKTLKIGVLNVQRCNNSGSDCGGFIMYVLRKSLI